MNQKIDKFKTHINKHKETYIVGGVCLVVGVATGYVFHSSLVKATIDNRQILSWKPINTSTNIITTELIRRGHPGNKIKCLESGVIYPSGKSAAIGEEVSPASVSKVINGILDSVKGKTFVNLGEMVQPEPHE